jgi:protein-tyrosine phosphatase
MTETDSDGFIDLHSHVIPAVDDGARSEEESLELLRGLHEIGYAEVVATPHARPGLWDPDDGLVRERLAQLRERAKQNGIPLVLGLGAEHYWDERVFNVDRSRLRPHGDAMALLIEVPTMKTPPGLEEACFRLRVKGLLPLLAHPERYPDLCADEERLIELSKHAAFVVDLGSLVGSDGKEIEKASRRLLKMGLCKAVATDVHRPEDIDDAAAGLDWIEEKLGKEALVRLAKDNPRKLLAGEWPE